MNLVREAFSLPGYVYKYVAGSQRESSSEPLLEQARVPLNSAELIINVVIIASIVGKLFTYCSVRQCVCFLYVFWVLFR